MSSTAGRYHPRAARYVLRPIDASLMRFAPLHTRGIAAQADVIDVSETGLSFTIDSDDTPHVGEVIKVEFTVPGRQQVACFALVVRVENQSNWHPEFGDHSALKIAIQFRDLPEAHRRSLQLGLQGRVAAGPDGSELSSPEPSSEESTLGPLLRLVLSGAGLIVLLYLMTIPPERVLAAISN